jgi:chromosome segregation ATPase
MTEHAVIDAPREATTETPSSAGGDAAVLDRRRIEEQLAQLERKRLELSRALLVADHPDLADPIRIVEGRLYAIERVEARMREGLSKSESRRVETLGKKRDTLSDKRVELDRKRAELDEEIAGVDRELAALGEERERAFERERGEALEALVVALAQHGGVFDAAAVEPSAVVPGLASRMSELRATAHALADRQGRAETSAPSTTRSPG